MTKENLKIQYDELEREIDHLAEYSAKLKVFIHSDEFKELSDLEATLAVAEHHQLEAFARTMMMRAALIGGRLQDPEGDRPVKQVNDEVPNKIITPDKPEISTGSSIRVGNTIITEG